jgi:hypothetical protein
LDYSFLGYDAMKSISEGGCLLGLCSMQSGRSYVSEVLTASIIMAIHPDDGGSKYL